MSTQLTPPSAPGPFPETVTTPISTPDVQAAYAPAQAAPEIVEEFTEVESAAIAWRRQNFVGACDGVNAAGVLGAPDLHLTFWWEDELCFLSIFPSEKGPPVRAYYRGFQKKPPTRTEALGKSRNIDMNLDLSNCSAEDAAKVLSSPERIFSEIEDSKSGKTGKDGRWDSWQSNTGVNPTAYTRDDDWQRRAVETGDVSNEQKAPSSRHTGSKPWTVDENGDLTSVTPLNKILNDVRVSGFQLEERSGEIGIREDAPWWVLDERRFNDFITSQGKTDALDRAILHSYYRLHWQDAEIYAQYEEYFKQERGQQRRAGTSSAGAVKKRRQRLVKAGNTLHGAEPPKPISQPLAQAQTVKRRAFSGLVGRY